MASMEERLLRAAIEGDVNSLHQLLHEDALLLDKFITGSRSETPLHIASMLGHVQFVQAILENKPELARELNSRRESPLHLSAVKGDVGIVSILVGANPDMCSVCDRDGRNPVHIAALRGHLGALRALVGVRPWAAQDLLENNETILHACVRHNQLGAMKVLLETISDGEFVNLKNHDGNTVLHMAVAAKQTEAVKYLIDETPTDIHSINVEGLAALDLLSSNRRHSKDKEIAEYLKKKGATNTQSVPLSDHEQQKKNKEEWFERKKNSLMVVASLLATMAFAGCLTPPGGLWQDDKEDKKAGLAILAYQKAQTYFPVHFPGHLYGWFLSLNTTGLVASLSIILLLVSGLPIKRRFFLWVLMVILWIAIIAMALTYVVAIIAYTPKHESKPLIKVLAITVLAWAALMLVLIIGHTINLIYKMPRFHARSRQEDNLKEV